MPAYSARELSAVRIFGLALLGVGIISLIASTPELISDFHDGRFETKESSVNPKSKSTHDATVTYIPGLAGVVFGIAFSALGMAALIALNRAEKQPQAAIEKLQS